MEYWDFHAGDMVVLKEDYRIDYGDCSDVRLSRSGSSLYKIPAGSFGFVVTNEDAGFGGRLPIFFSDVENYPALYCHEKQIGPGHYIPYRILDLVSPKEDDRIRFETGGLDALFRYD